MKALVTGGGGFLGGAIVRALLQRGDQVHSLHRGDYPELAQAGVTVHKGDMTELQTVIQASEGCDVIFHVAGKTGVWGSYQDYFRTNVTGTQCVINACIANNIRRLIYTSSPSVVFDGSDEENINESVSYPDRYFNHYQRTKATAEQLVLAANNDELSTVALRPHLIWGPGDPHLVDRILNRARSDRLRLAKGKQSLVDTTFVDNAVDAHLCAADRLNIHSTCAGKAYFISNGEPLPIAEIINRILVSAGLAPVKKTMSAGMLYLIGSLSERIYWLFNIKQEPLMTRFIARQLSCAHWYDISAAKQDLGYKPQINIDEGMQRLADHFTSIRHEH